MSNLLYTIREALPEDVTTEVLARLLQEFSVCRKAFLSLLDISNLSENYEVQPQCSFETGRPDLVLHNEQLFVIIENKPWKSSSFGVDQMKRYAKELQKIEAQGKTLCLLASEKNKGDLLQAVATEECEGIAADESSLKEHYATNYGIDFIIITWEQVLESFGAFLPKYAVVEFLVKELRDFLFSPETKQPGESQMVSQVTDMPTVLCEMLVDLKAQRDGEHERLSTGFIDLDVMLGGFHPNELIILASRPSMGKTAFATNIVDHVAVVQKKTAIIFSLEMTRTDLARRMICCRGRIDAHKLRAGYMSEADHEALAKATTELGTAPLYIDDAPSQTVAQITTVARRLKRQGNIGLIVIDNLGLIKPDNPTVPRQEQIAKIVKQLKILAHELKVPILCLAQLNRAFETAKDNRPLLNHLRESEAIEQVADVVMFVHREEYYLKRELAEEMGVVGQAEIIIAKQRNGPIGTVKLAWIGEYMLFANLAEASPNEIYQFQRRFRRVLEHITFYFSCVTKCHGAGGDVFCDVKFSTFFLDLPHVRKAKYAGIFAANLWTAKE